MTMFATRYYALESDTEQRIANANEARTWPLASLASAAPS